MSVRVLAVCGALLAQAGCATMSQSAGPPKVTSSAVDCSHFKSKPEGQWRATQATRLGATTLQPGQAVPYGLIVSGVDLVVILAGKCAAAPPAQAGGTSAQPSGGEAPRP